MRGDLGDKERLQHILQAINKIENFVADVSEQEFLKDEMRRLACQRLLEIIGEAARCLSADFKQLHSHIEWKKIIGLRNVMAHQYFDINVTIVWQVIKIDLLVFKIDIENALSARY